MFLTVVTGCTRGLGRAYVDELAAAGLNIILLARAEEQLKEISEEIGNVRPFVQLFRSLI